MIGRSVIQLEESGQPSDKPIPRRRYLGLQLVNLAILFAMMGAFWIALARWTDPEFRMLDAPYARLRLSAMLTWSASGRVSQWALPGVAESEVRILHAQTDSTKEWLLLEIDADKWDRIESAIYAKPKPDGWRVTPIKDLAHFDRSLDRSPEWLPEVRNLPDLQGVGFDHRSQRLGWILVSRAKHWILICDSMLR